MSVASDLPLQQPEVDTIVNIGKSQHSNSGHKDLDGVNMIEMGVAYPTDAMMDNCPTDISPHDINSLYSRAISPIWHFLLTFAGFVIPDFVEKSKGKALKRLYIFVYIPFFWGLLVLGTAARWIQDGFLDAVICIAFTVFGVTGSIFGTRHLKLMVAVLMKSDPYGVFGCRRLTTRAGVLLLLFSFAGGGSLTFTNLDKVWTEAAFGATAGLAGVPVLGSWFVITVVVSRGLVRHARLLYTQAERVVQGSNNLSVNVTVNSDGVGHGNENKITNAGNENDSALHSVIIHHSNVIRNLWWVSRKLSPPLVPGVIAMSLSAIALAVTGFWTTDLNSRLSIWVWALVILGMGISFLFPLAWVTEGTKNAISRVSMLISSSETGMVDGSRTALLTQMMSFTRGMELLGMTVAMSFLVKLFYFLFSIVLFASRFI